MVNHDKTKAQNVPWASQSSGNFPLDTHALEVSDKSDTVLELLTNVISKLDKEFKHSNSGLKAIISITLFKYVMKYSPRNSCYFNRDRLVTSGRYAGGWQCLFGRLVQAKDIATDQRELPDLLSKNISPCHSGQAISSAVGLAIATKNLAALYNKRGFELIDNMIWCFIDENKFQHENALQAITFAGSWKLSNPCVIYDGSDIFNHQAGHRNISIANLKASGWNVIEVADKDPTLCMALGTARRSSEPTFIIIQSRNNSVLYKRLDARNDEFNSSLPRDIYDFFENVCNNGDVYEADWMSTFKAYAKLYPALAKEFWLHVAGKRYHNNPFKPPTPGNHLLDNSNLLSDSMTPPPSAWSVEPRDFRQYPSRRVKRSHPRRDKSGHAPVICVTSNGVKPDTLYIRPCDTEEVAGAFLVAIKSTQLPTTISLHQQSTARYLDHSSRLGVTFGGYIFSDVDTDDLDIILISAGFGIEYAMGTRDFLLENYSLKVRVASFPCVKLFQLQPEEYKQSVLQPHSGRPTVAIDTGNGKEWAPYADALVSLEDVGKVSPRQSQQEGLYNQLAQIGPRVKGFIDEFGYGQECDREDGSYSFYLVV
ncbi:thiamine diphosphate-binding protein [Dactylonectria macrodidyma]|uniref:Thiamine diphosphate-binding protein n=1 Tax=Dactylonectria macrodidyma TaxID=307937 RepID=A0A9P9DWK9_9HYPO|nr:thiamine diphosphate-binding protein [Dactylonectria macrodidyma]